MYKLIPKGTNPVHKDKVVKKVTMLVNSISKKGGVHTALSPREIITVKKLQIPKYKIS